MVKDPPVCWALSVLRRNPRCGVHRLRAISVDVSYLGRAIAVVRTCPWATHMPPEGALEFGLEDPAVNDLRVLAARLSSASRKVPVRDNLDVFGFSLARIAEYASKQIVRLAELHSAGIELHAWTARNVFEAYLICELIVRSPVKAKQFISQKATDELQIYEGLLGLADDPDDPSRQPIIERSEHIRRTLAKHAMPEGRPWSVASLAKQTGHGAEYETFFKLYSKYIHASAWLIFGNSEEVDTIIFATIFLRKAQSYAALILSRVEEEIEKQSDPG
jgi:hypothetical protein